MNKKSFYTIKLFVIVLVITSSFSCKKNNNSDTQIPNVPVSFTVYLSLPQFVSLNSVGGYVTVVGGYRGIIIYRRALEEFVSFDLACPFDPTVSGAKIQVDSSGITTVDPHCGSKFSLYDGSVLHGPATRPMKSYNSVYDSNNNSVYVSN